MSIKRPTYRAFYDEDLGVRWHDINPDGTPGPEVTWRVLMKIGSFLQDAIYCGDGWLVDFFAALKQNGKANLRGDDQ